MNNNLDLVIIYRRIEKQDVINYIPVYSELGTYNQESEVFTTTKGKKYHHMIEGEEYAFLGRLPLSRYTDLYPKSSLFTIKTKAFINNAKHRYILSESKDNVPIVLQVEKTKFDVERAKTGILVIDKLEEISTNSKERHSTSSKALQEIIINLIDEGVFTINTIDNEKYRFSMDKLLIIGIGNFNNNENLRNTTVGFNTALEDNTLDSYGIIPELANKFPILIEMNNLTLDDYINIIKNSTLSSLNTNREFLGKRNINLEISEEVINMIARIAYDRKLGAKSINEILESSLALAEFEIASNSSLYESLIIDKSTIKDNKKYTLVKRKNN